MFSSWEDSSKSKQLPVFVFPEELTFQRKSKQILTLYNPYDVILNFKSRSLSKLPELLVPH